MSKDGVVEDAVTKLSHRPDAMRRTCERVPFDHGGLDWVATALRTTLFHDDRLRRALLPCSCRTSRKDLSMNLTISGHHLEVTPALREYVLTKLDRVTRHFDQVVDITVLLSVEKLSEKERRQKAEVTLHVKGKDIFAECTSEDLYAAIDQLMDKLDRQVVPPQGQGPGPPPRRRPSGSTPTLT